ncbi:leucine-rich repeat, cysteine-containing subtype protein, partial [Tanacetum coccineum]
RCPNLEVLYTGDVCRDKGLQVIGMHLKNLRKFCMLLDKIGGTTDLHRENGIRAMLMGCNKLKSLYINIWLGRLADVGLKYIAKYGANLLSLSLTGTGESNAGLVKLSEGCPRLRKLKLWGFPFSKQVVASSMFNIQSLRYVWLYGAGGNILLGPTRPEFQL